jgi:hypothetical protein
MKGGGMKIKIKAKVLEPKTVKTDTGQFRNCMKIRFSGKIYGEVDVWGGSSIDSGSFVEIYWYAKRVGLVKYKSKQEIDIVFRNG